MPDLRPLRDDLSAFAAAVGQPLTRWQSDALLLRHRTSVVVAPRQSGKSRSLSVLAAWWAFRNPGSRVLLVSAGEDASKRLLAEAASIVQGSALLSGSVTDEMTGLLSLSNGSEIRSVSASEKAVRGWTVDLLVADECVQIDPELLLSACLPTVAARAEGRIVLASSPGPPEGPFYDFATSESESVHVAHWALQDAVWIAPEVIEQAREQLPPSAFAREFEGKFTDAGDETIIPREWITAAQERTTTPTERVVCGVDLGRGGDESVFVRLDGDQARVVWTDHTPDLMRVADRIASTLRDDRTDPTALLDVTGLGFGPFDRLRELGCNVSAFYASGRAANPTRHLNLRAQAWFDAREQFRLGKIDLDPADKVLAAQLAAQKFTISTSGALQVASKTGQRGSPDRADALILALHLRGVRGPNDYIALAKSIAASTRRERARKADPLTLTAREHIDFHKVYGVREPSEGIVPESDVRNSAGGRHDERGWYDS